MLSVIIPTLNEEHYLPKLLESLRTQNYRDMEIIVSDGNSSDQTIEIAKLFNCTVVTSDKRSPANQRNLGESIAHGDLLLFLDADVVLPPHFLIESLFEFQLRNLDIASCLYRLDSTRPVLRLASLYTFVFMRLASYFFPITSGACIFVKKTYFQKVGGFDYTSIIGEDNVFTKAVLQAGGNFRLLTSRYFTLSARRYEKEGPWRSYFKLQYILLYFLLHGKIDKAIVSYEFGSYGTPKTT